MKASKFSEAQIAVVLKQAEDGSAVAKVCVNLSSRCEATGRFRSRGPVRPIALRYKSKRGDQAALKHRIKDICETRMIRLSPHPCSPST